MPKNIKIKRFDKSLPLPEYKTKGAVGFDLAARETVVISAGTVGRIPLNIAIEIPKGYFIVQASRSSAHKLGIMAANGIGIIDSDFCGDGDEYIFLAYNFTKKAVTIEKGTRIAQGILMKYEQANWKEVQKMKAETRGGIGSTGHK